MQLLIIPELKWDNISMYFVTSLPKIEKGCDSIWVIVNRLTKSAHFILIKISYSLQKLEKLYIEKIVSLHGIPSSIVSNRDPRFTSRFGEGLQTEMSTKQMTIQSLEYLLGACVLDQRGVWDIYLSLIEFTYNNNFHLSIGITLFKGLYGWRCRTPLCWYELGENVVLRSKFFQQTNENIKMIQERMKA